MHTSHVTSNVKYTLNPAISNNMGDLVTTSMTKKKLQTLTASAFNSSTVLPACFCNQASSAQTGRVELSLIRCGFAKFTRIVRPKSSDSFCEVRNELVDVETLTYNVISKIPGHARTCNSKYYESTRSQTTTTSMLQRWLT